MGKPRKPQALHDVEGTKPQFVYGSTDDTTPGRPKVPKGLSRGAKKSFKALSRQLESRRHLTAGDGELLRLAAVLIDRHQRAIEHLQSEGEIVRTLRVVGGVEIPVEAESLWLKIAQSSEKQLTAILDRLGLSPRERGRIRPTTAPADEEHAAEEAFFSSAAAPPPEPKAHPSVDDIPLEGL
jgi:P27 family predicted phage terminase small subunit